MQHAELTILVDNRAGRGCVEEHGFALWIDTGDKRVLLDTGQGMALAVNARTLGIDLGQTDALVLSHGHYDHTGAVPLVLGSAPQARVYCHPEVAGLRYSVRDGVVRDIGIPETSMRALHALSKSRVHWATQPVLVGDGIGLTGAIPRLSVFEDTGGPFYLDHQGRRSDQLVDDQALWMATDAGLVVCLGCCHAGLVNTLKYLREITGEDRIRAVIGGLHLGAASPERLAETVLALRKMRPGLLVPCHCTGDAAIACLRENLDCEVRTGYAGMQLDTGLF